MLVYARQNITKEDVKAVQEALQKDWITRGPIVTEFEEAVASFCGARFGIAFNSGTSALTAAFNAIQINPIDRVFTPANTFIGSITGALQQKVLPQFIETDLEIGSLSFEHLSKMLDRPVSRGRDVVVPVHYAGPAISMQGLQQKLKNIDSIIIEDAAHAFGSCYPDGKRVGSCAYSDMTIFSFHPCKTVTTGEGGMVMTNDEQLAAKLKQWRNNGIQPSDKPDYYEVHTFSGNSHLTDFQAALGLSQLNRIDETSSQRQQLTAYYRQKLDGNRAIRPLSDPYPHLTTPHLFPVQIDFKNQSRDQVMQALQQEDISTQVHYIPLYRHPAIAKLVGNLTPKFPQTEKFYAQTLSLPLHNKMDEKDIDRVIDSLTKTLS